MTSSNSIPPTPGILDVFCGLRLKQLCVAQAASRLATDPEVGARRWEDAAEAGRCTAAELYAAVGQ